MEKTSKSKKELLKELHSILDNFSYEDLGDEEKKYISSLIKRLKELQDYKIESQKKIEEIREEETLDPLEPKVVIHHSTEGKDIYPKATEQEVTVEKQEKPSIREDDLYEVEKPDIQGPEFIEVKPKEKKVLVEDREKDNKINDVQEWEPVNSIEKRKINEVEEDASESLHQVDEAEYNQEVEKLKQTYEEPKVVKKEYNFCPECGCKLDNESEFCPKCGIEVKIEKIPEPVEEELIRKKEKYLAPESREFDNDVAEQEDIENVTIDKKEPDVEIPEVSEVKDEEYEEHVVPAIDIEEEDNEEKINVFKTLDSVDDNTAILLYDAGYKSLESLKASSAKELKKIKGLKKSIYKDVLKEISDLKKQEEKIESTEEENFSEFLREEDLDNDENGLIEEKIEEELEKELEEVKTSESEEDVDPFDNLDSVDSKTSELLIENGIDSLADLEGVTIRDLTKIKGIRRRLAKKIKKELRELDEKERIEKEDSLEDLEDIEESEEKITDEWESVDEELVYNKSKGFKYNDYFLFEKEISVKGGGTRAIRFFSKEEPEEGVAIELPEGYEVKINKRTGVPYLKKKK